MTIARNPKKDAEASRFIRGASKDGAGARRKLITIWLNVDEDLLNRVNDMAKSMGLNRTAFITNAVAEKLRQLEQKP